MIYVREAVTFSISIHSPRMGRDLTDALDRGATDISIHSPRMGRDLLQGILGHSSYNFNPLSPHGERHATVLTRRRGTIFQSTLPAWGETQSISGNAVCRRISIHSPRMGRDDEAALAKYGRKISIHSPRMGRDASQSVQEKHKQHFNPLSPHGERPMPHYGVPPKDGFQSTLPAWGETELIDLILTLLSISIHSPRMGRDMITIGKTTNATPFQSTLPAWGETYGIKGLIEVPELFQSTLPAWGETIGQNVTSFSGQISIHSPRMGRDGSRPGRSSGRPYFNPLSPHGERRCAFWRPTRKKRFQSTLPAWGETFRAF